jgi:hypothetical protein
MEGYITYSQLGLLIIFMVVVVAGGYAVMTLRNVNTAVKDLGAILKENREAIKQVIPNIARASENVLAITKDLQTDVSEMSKAMTTVDPITTYAVVIGETAKALANLFATIRSH